MNEQKYDNRMLTDYLLGALPEADAERFDELSFTDDEFAAALQAAENDLVDSYARGELATATRKQFETHYLASPLRREKVAFADALQTQAEKHLAATKNEIATFIESKPKRVFKEILAGIFIVPRPSLQWGFALAALAFLFFGGWLWRENSRLRYEMSAANANREQLLQRETELAGREKQLRDAVANQSSADSETEKELAQIREERAQLEEQLKKQTQQQQRLVEQQKLNERQLAEQRNSPPISTPRVAIASFVLAPSLRGGTRIQTVSIPARTAGVSATLELEADEYTAYRAVLRSASGEKILWQSGELKSKSVGGNTRLSVNFPANLLQTGIYSIELTGIAADGAAEIVGDYSFRVVR